MTELSEEDNETVCNLKFCIKGNYLVSRDFPSYAKQLSRVTEFSFCTEQPFQILFHTLFLCQFYSSLNPTLFHLFYAKKNIQSILENDAPAFLTMLAAQCGVS